MLAVNGEIYNHRDIRARYAGKYAFQTGSDCEVILALYTFFSKFLGNIIVDVLAAFGGKFLGALQEAVPLRLRQSTVDILAGDSILDQSEYETGIEVIAGSAL